MIKCQKLLIMVKSHQKLSMHEYQSDMFSLSHAVQQAIGPIPTNIITGIILLAFGVGASAIIAVVMTSEVLLLAQLITCPLAWAVCLKGSKWSMKGEGIRISIESFLQHLIGACDASFTLAHSAIHGD